MQHFKSFWNDLRKLTPDSFDDFALRLFQFQACENKVYTNYLSAREIDPKKISTVEEIPFLPIQFFKNFKVVSGSEDQFSEFFSSSGTTGMITSRHYFLNENEYLDHTVSLFQEEYGSIKDYHILALLPAYLERKGSSLVSMANHWIQESGSPYSGFYLYNHQDLISRIEELAQDQRKILLLGVTFALLDLVESGIKFSPPENLIVMETGGMKGRRKEMIREEVHEVLKPFFGVSEIHSEYGMTELFSQSYSKGQGKYKIPRTMDVILRDLNDPFSLAEGQRGGINIIDLANIHSCAFIETQDLGSIDDLGMLEVLGRIDNSEIRGCNLLV
ncbi:acyl transferase [Algoriphagus sediminis]|uniref:Acyl transferase n=1 Tax=Algoriphagus sediminis TaxID=3057113 RepID=A0ABT7YAE3_9BACT|nr:acyl transferase [Algoriphagus sediminis]MDN3203493.1 acyl transferase [Algoriphagus sediminis]